MSTSWFREGSVVVEVVASNALAFVSQDYEGFGAFCEPGQTNSCSSTSVRMMRFKIGQEASRAMQLRASEPKLRLYRVGLSYKLMLWLHQDLLMESFCRREVGPIVAENDKKA